MLARLGAGGTLVIQLTTPGNKVGEMTECSGAPANVIIQPLIGSQRR